MMKKLTEALNIFLRELPVRNASTASLEQPRIYSIKMSLDLGFVISLLDNWVQLKLPRLRMESDYQPQRTENT